VLANRSEILVFQPEAAGGSSPDLVPGLLNLNAPTGSSNPPAPDILALHLKFHLKLPAARYTPESVFDTFPWPQSPTVSKIDAVASTAREVRRVRSEALTKIKGGLRALYRALELPERSPLKDAHAALDAAVLSAYFTPERLVGATPRPQFAGGPT